MELRCPLVEVNRQARQAKPQRSSQDITTGEGSLLRAQTIVELQPIHPYQLLQYSVTGVYSGRNGILVNWKCKQ